MVSLGSPYHLKLFKSCLPQILLGLFLNTLTQMITFTSNWIFLIQEQNKVQVKLKDFKFEIYRRIYLLHRNTSQLVNYDKSLTNQINIWMSFYSLSFWMLKKASPYFAFSERKFSALHFLIL